jgi:copper chaperone CopZ
MNQITNFIAETKALLAHTYNDRPGLKSTHTLEGMSCGSCVTKITNKLLEHPDIIAAEVTLQPPQATITSRKTLADDDLNTWLQPFGHYRVKSTEAEPSLPAGDATTYRPLILLLLYLLTVTAAVMAASGGWNTSLAMRVFMGGFFIAFSFFKLLDPRGFADAYRGYDLVARKWPAYGLIYPFIELGLGLAYLANVQPMLVNAVTAVVMAVSLAGVLRAVFSKRAIRCACLGTVFKLPMSTVTIIEDGLMLAMAVLALVLPH